jgi:hypothetical protein
MAYSSRWYFEDESHTHGSFSVRCSKPTAPKSLVFIAYHPEQCDFAPIRFQRNTQRSQPVTSAGTTPHSPPSVDVESQLDPTELGIECEPMQSTTTRRRGHGQQLHHQELALPTRPDDVGDARSTPAKHVNAVLTHKTCKQSVRNQNLALTSRTLVPPFVACTADGDPIVPQRCLHRSADAQTCDIVGHGRPTRTLITLNNVVQLDVPAFRCRTHQTTFSALHEALAGEYQQAASAYRFSYSLLFTRRKLITVELANALVCSMLDCKFNHKATSRISDSITGIDQDTRQAMPNGFIKPKFATKLLSFYARTHRQLHNTRIIELRKHTGSILRIDHTYKFASTIGVATAGDNPNNNNKWVWMEEVGVWVEEERTNSGWRRLGTPHQNGRYQYYIW